MEMITSSERKLIGLGEFDPVPSGGISYQLYSFSGFGVDSTSSWNSPRSDVYGPISLKSTLRQTFDIEFCPGSLNVRLIQGTPWIPLECLNPQRIRLGVFTLSYALPIILNEKCIGIAAAINVRGFDPATGERILPPLQLNDKVEMYQIYSPINIRERLNLEDKMKSNSVTINARLLSGDLLTVSELDKNYESRSQ